MTDDVIAQLMANCEHCSCYRDEDDVLPCCNCGELGDDYEDLPADEADEAAKDAWPDFGWGRP